MIEIAVGIPIIPIGRRNTIYPVKAHPVLKFGSQRNLGFWNRKAEPFFDRKRKYHPREYQIRIKSEFERSQPPALSSRHLGFVGKIRRKVKSLPSGKQVSVPESEHGTRASEIVGF